ncbi:MAG: flagellar hook-associated protein FlgL [Nitrospirae bacterium]|nr:flagellar hook-associated protein FlgL [Nitrospirota bacterium]
MIISNKTLYDRFLLDLRGNLSAIQTAQEQVASGKRINRPSDDPTGTYQSMDYSVRIGRMDQYRRNSTAARTLLSHTDTTLQSASNAITRAYELAVQYASGTYTSTDRANGAKELVEIRESVAGLANTRIGDRYIFGGWKTAAPPYAKTIVIEPGVNDSIVFDDGTAGGPFTVTLDSAIYTPGQLADEIKSKLEAANGSADVYDVSFSYDTNKFSVAGDADNANTLDLLWTDAGSTAAATLGFDTGADDSVAAGSTAEADSAVGFTQGFTVTSSNKTFRADFGAGLQTVTLTEGAYTEASLITEIQTRLGPANVTVDYDSSTARFSLTNISGAPITFAWSDPLATARNLLGFDSADDTVASSASTTADDAVYISETYMFQGDTGSINISVGDGAVIASNVAGSDAFSEIFASMDKFITAMNANDIDGINVAIGSLQTDQNSLRDTEATAGARLNRLDIESERNEDEQLSVQQALSGVEDADIIEAAMVLARRQAAIDTLRSANIKTLSQSLFDFLQ